MCQSICIIEDHGLYRAGLRAALETHFNHIAVLEVASMEQAVQVETKPVLVLLDIKLPGLSGLDGQHLLRNKWPAAQVIVLSADTTEQNMEISLAKGAVAFIDKNASTKTIMAIIAQVLQSLLPASTAERLISLPDAAHRMDELKPEEKRTLPTLTTRQSTILTLLNQGLSNKMIGKKMHVSEHTVRWHVQNILAVLKVASRSEAVFAARRMGLIA